MKRYEPMLARTAETPFSSDEWIFEVKWDGIRAIAYINDELSIRSRNQVELKDNFPELVELKKVAKNCVLDGEIVITREGKVDFQTLIERMQKTSPRDIEFSARSFPATYVVFDVLEYGGKSTLNLPLIERKRILKNALKEGKHVLLSVYADSSGKEFFDAAINKGLEGAVAKKKQSTYQPGYRSPDWLKIKKIKSCDCAVFGYTLGEASRRKTFGALILGVYDEGKPVYVGKVGTGFSEDDLDDIKNRFKKLETGKKTIEGVEAGGEIVWLNPGLVCEVGYQTVTRDGRLRMPRFRGLRLDKSADDCTLDQLSSEPLREYQTKRDFGKTPEPLGIGSKGTGMFFVVHEHHARRLHYDLRLERSGVLKSWAVPKGPPDKPGDKRLAVKTEDHPLEYGEFEGTIPKGQYGAGTVKIWDKGLYQPLIWQEDKIELIAKGDRLEGRYVLVRLKKAGEKNWLMLKARD